MIIMREFSKNDEKIALLNDFSVSITSQGYISVLVYPGQNAL